MGAASFARAEQAAPLASTGAGDTECTPLTIGAPFIGPAQSVAEAEAESLQQLKGATGVPQRPFGFANAAWLDLKAGMKPGDRLHRYNIGDEGGHLVLRNGCLVGRLMEWAR
ncbi:hypothetical protein [Tahibacter aquaticus]|uniref:hypothetical protein n=1 Tax=Tahibacter aquaticus TaxID=520092 RepID=UPI001061B28F|nr:hypothetical protein [Tahibacter aquaticus]